MADTVPPPAPESPPPPEPPPGPPPAPPTAAAPEDGSPTATRRDIQIGRRLFHLSNGVAIATAYALLFTHTQIVYLFGTIACLIYILDRVRIHYPELMRRVPWVNERFFRTEEQFREAAMTPFAIAILLTLITFPKPIALIAVYTLGIADPLSAVVGITWGRRRIVPGRTVEGSLAFLVATVAVASAVLAWAFPEVPLGPRLWASLLIGILGALCETLPLRIDDNLTIPLAVGFSGWIVCALFGIPV
jgi:dolichol kinase